MLTLAMVLALSISNRPNF